MSVEKSLADQRVDKILAEIKVLQDKMKEYEPPKPTKETPSTKEEDPYEHVHTCPTCKDKLQKEKDDYSREQTQKAFKERASYPFQCVGCGLGVKVEETECPACGNKRANPRK
jgi:hypothetical protein